MATPAGGTPVSPGMVQRVTGAIKYLATGQPPEWFGPGNPLPPSAPDEVKGRPWDFMTGQNINTTPKQDQGGTNIDFVTLRRISDPTQGGLDLIRIAIETRKDQMEAQKWTIKGRDGTDGGPRAKDIAKRLRRPDGVRSYRQWARPQWDDLLVIDAPALYCRPIPGGTFLPEVVDGATIKIVVDRNGRTPHPPETAYQQIIKGLAAVDYTLDEIIYSPRNLRSYRFYGMSPVEQVLGIANLALKRQLHLLNYYTEGNLPDAAIFPPESWNPDQIKAAQTWLDTLTDSATRRKIRIMPGGRMEQMKDPKLKDELDDWLSRIICWCFNLPPGALVKDMTKATGQTNANTAHEEGLEPLKLWWKDVMDEVISRCFGADDLEFAYNDEEISDPKVKMEVWTGYKNAGLVTADEAREKGLGLDPMTPEQKAEVAPPPPIALGAAAEPGKPGQPATPPGKVESASPSPVKSEKHAHTDGLQKKKAQVLNPIDRDRPTAVKCAKAVGKLFKGRFAAQRDALVAAVLDGATKLAKMTPDQFTDLWDSLSDEGREELRAALADELEKMARDGAAQAQSQVFMVTEPGDRDLDAMLSQANEKAVAFAEDRAAELVGMKYNPETSEWITNPNPAWAIDETTRDNIQRLTTTAETEGWSNDMLADAIREDEGFSEARAEMIARTETAFADVQGNVASYEASGLVEAMEWIVGAGECEICEENAAAGPIPLGDLFPSGDDMPPAHPNCRCDVLPVVTPAEESEA